MTARLAQLEALARRAGELALAHYGRAAFELKEDHSPVSVADREVEAFLRQELWRLDPQAAFVGEETAQEPERLGRARDAERVWVVDPVDGTAAFVGQLDTFAVCIGQLRHGEPHLGVVALPALDQVYAAERGSGAFWTTPRGRQPIQARPTEQRGVSFLLVPSNSHRSYGVSYRGKVRSLGSTAYHFVLVARGLAVGAVSRSHVWDYVAAVAVLLEAGGEIRRLDGQPVDWRGLLDGRVCDVPTLGAHPDRWQELCGQLRWPREAC